MYVCDQSGAPRIVKNLGGVKAIDWNTVAMYFIEMSPCPYGTLRTPVRFLLDYIFEKSYVEKNI